MKIPRRFDKLSLLGFYSLWSFKTFRGEPKCTKSSLDAINWMSLNFLRGSTWRIGERKNGKSKFVRPLASNWSLPGGSNHLSVPKQVQTITEKSLWAAKVGHPPCRFTPVLQWTAENIFTYTQDLWDRWCRATRFSLRNITWNSMKWNTFKILFRF